MSDRDLDHLTQELREKAILWLGMCNKQAGNGDKYIIICTYRSNEDQAAAYAIGRTKPGKIITNARPGQSKHNKVDKFGKPASEAFDFIILRFGKVVHNGDDLAYKLAGVIAEGFGLVWSGRWSGKLRESGHIETKGER